MKHRSLIFYIIIVLALLAVAGLVLYLAPGRTPDTPAVLLPAPAPTENAGGSAAQETDTVLAVTPATVQAALATLHRADCYSRTLQVTDFYSGGSRSRSISVSAKDGMLRLDLVPEDGAAEHVLLADGQKWLWYDDAPDVYSGPAADSDMDGYQTILTYEDVLAAPAKDILDAGYTEFGGMNCIYVRWRFGTMGYVSECYVDPVSGLLMGERCYDGEALIYSMDSDAPDLKTPKDNRFAVPKS